MRTPAFARALAALSLIHFLLAPAAQAQGTDEPQFEVTAYQIEGDLPIGPERAQSVLKPFTGPAVTLSQLKDAAKALEAELSAAGYPFYRVVLPAQTAENVVRLQVLKFHLAAIEITNNKYFSRENVLRSLPALRLGEATNVSELARNRALLNEHPSKNVEVNFAQGEKTDEVNAQVAVQDEAPMRVFFGLNNIGNDQTGQVRATIGLQHSNLWNRDHAMTATFTTSPDHFSDVKQYGLYYRVPFYSVGGSLTMFAAYSDVNSGTIANAFQVSGRGQFAGIHWRQHLVPKGAYSHGVELGYDDRLFENDVLFGGQQLGANVRTRPVTAGYFGRYDQLDWTVAGGAQYVHNIGGGSDTGPAAYESNRAGASRDWSAIRITLDGQMRVAPIIFTGRVRAQYADEPLVPGEQFGIGGATSVRGLKEREVTGDSGWFASVEAIYPLPWGQGFSAVAFLDAGQVSLENVAPGALARQDASSFGIGLRWVVGRRFAATVDAAQVLNGTTVTNHGMRRVHFALLYYL